MYRTPIRKLPYLLRKEGADGLDTLLQPHGHRLASTRVGDKRMQRTGVLEQYRPKLETVVAPPRKRERARWHKWAVIACIAAVAVGAITWRVSSRSAAPAYQAATVT